MNVLRIEIEDDRVEDDIVWVHEVPIDTPMAAIGAAIQTLYPTATEVSIRVAEKEE
jgi:hypothetical protein